MHACGLLANTYLLCKALQPNKQSIIVKILDHYNLTDVYPAYIAAPASENFYNQLRYSVTYYPHMLTLSTHAEAVAGMLTRQSTTHLEYK